MRRTLVLLVCFMVWTWLPTDITPAAADDTLPPPVDLGGTPRAQVPLGAPPGASQVPVPDVRGQGEAQAMRSLAESGLSVGGVERVSIERLERELGRSYQLGVVVQQAPRPSTGSDPSWLARGAPVWLRVAAQRDEGVTRPATPVIPYTPATPTQPTYRPTPAQPSYPAGTIPPRPPPPYPIDGSPQPYVAPPGDTTPYVAPPADTTPYVAPPADTTPYVAPPADTATYDPGAGTYSDAELGLLSDVRSSIALPCERRQGRWHVRGVGGIGFPMGTDKGDAGWYAGGDVGHTFAGCIGVDLFYRYARARFDRMVTGGLLEDAGGFHHVGVKATFQGSLSRGSPIFGWVGLGVGWYKSRGYQQDDNGVGGYAEAGIGYMLSSAMRLRLGVMVHALDTDAARFDPANDGKSRMLWLVAPTLSVELDL